jgi:hypothetical protein
MTKKKLFIFLIVLSVGVAFLFFAYNSEYDLYRQTQKSKLTSDIAIDILRDVLIEGDCKSEGEFEQYQSCVISIANTDRRWDIEVIYDGFYDDSVRGSRLRANAIYENDDWSLTGDVIQEHKCWPNRGHQDFSSELCI